MKQNIKQKIDNYIKSRRMWVPKWEIEEFAKEIGCLAETASRKSRLLAEQDLSIQHKIIDGIVHYKYDPFFDTSFE